MPVIQSNGVAIDAEISGPEGAPVLMLSNSLGTTRHMWDPQMAAFTAKYRVLRYDRRGHGKSAVPKGPYSMEMLGRDAVTVLDGLGIKKANWLGLSMGGMEGMWLGANAGDRFDKIILSNTSTHYADKTMWHNRMDAVTKGGSVAAIADMVINAWLTQGFQKSHPDTASRMKEMMIATPVEGYLACCAAVRDMDHREIIKGIRNPTLIIAGSKDPATNVAAAEFIRDNIPGSKLAIVEAAHIANVEVPEVYAKTVLDFLGSK
jgi:3-oxoadipate enol-lactonase